MRPKLIILLFTLLVVIINITAISYLDFFYSQIIRLAFSSLFLLLFLILKIKGKLILSFLILLVIADVIDLYYLEPLMTELFSLVKIVAFSILCIIIFRLKKIKKFENKVAILFSIVIILNLLIGYNAVNELSILLYNKIEMITMFINWIVSVFTAAVAAKYYFDSESKVALYFICFTFLFIFADLSGFVSNSFEIKIYLYIERVLYFLAFMYLTLYLFFKEKKDAEGDKLF